MKKKSCHLVSVFFVMILSQNYFLLASSKHTYKVHKSSVDSRDHIAINMLDLLESKMDKRLVTQDTLNTVNNTRALLKILVATLANNENFADIADLYNQMWQEFYSLIKSYKRITPKRINTLKQHLNLFIDKIRMQSIAVPDSDSLLELINTTHEIIQTQILDHEYFVYVSGLLPRAHALTVKALRKIRQYPFESVFTVAALSTALWYFRRGSSASQDTHSSDQQGADKQQDKADYRLLHALITAKPDSIAALQEYLRHQKNDDGQQVSLKQVLALDGQNIKHTVDMLRTLTTQLNVDQASQDDVIQALEVIKAEQQQPLDFSSITSQEKEKLVTSLNTILPILVKVVENKMHDDDSQEEVDVGDREQKDYAVRGAQDDGSNLFSPNTSQPVADEKQKSAEGEGADSQEDSHEDDQSNASSSPVEQDESEYAQKADEDAQTATEQGDVHDGNPEVDDLQNNVSDNTEPLNPDDKSDISNDASGDKSQQETQDPTNNETPKHDEQDQPQSWYKRTLSTDNKNSWINRKVLKRDGHKQDTTPEEASIQDGSSATPLAATDSTASKQDSGNTSGQAIPVDYGTVDHVSDSSGEIRDENESNQEDKPLIDRGINFLKRTFKISDKEHDTKDDAKKKQNNEKSQEQSFFKRAFSRKNK